MIFVPGFSLALSFKAHISSFRGVVFPSGTLYILRTVTMEGRGRIGFDPVVSHISGSRATPALESLLSFIAVGVRFAPSGELRGGVP